MKFCGLSLSQSRSSLTAGRVKYSATLFSCLGVYCSRMSSMFTVMQKSWYVSQCHFIYITKMDSLPFTVFVPNPTTLKSIFRIITILFLFYQRQFVYTKTACICCQEQSEENNLNACVFFLLKHCYFLKQFLLFSCIHKFV